MLSKALLEKLDGIARRHEELAKSLSDPTVLANPARYRGVAKEHAALAKFAVRLQRLRLAREREEQARSVIEESRNDEAMLVAAREELQSAQHEQEALEEEIKGLLLEEDRDAFRDVIMEIRAGTGGEEAALFAADLFRMYSKYAEKRGWQVELMDKHVSDLGGVKEIVLSIRGEDVYRRLRLESGVHRVQRVPATEASGRIHTSTATVAVLPEAEELDIVIGPDDLEMDFFRSSGPGGQNVNKVSSAVRLVHKPTGLVVNCQEESSQHKNRAKAMRLLRTRLYERARQQQATERAESRRLQIGSGDRSEKIRTYNFPQNRVTDHRIHLDLYGLDAVLQGNLDPIIDALIARDREERLKNI